MEYDLFFNVSDSIYIEINIFFLHMKYFNIKYFICQKIYESHIYMNLTYLKKGG